MTLEDAFPSAFLRATDLEGKAKLVTVTGAKLETIGDDPKRKLVLTLRECSPKLVCNKTNAATIAALSPHSRADGR